jgi:dethiobiotin synthetase
MPAAAAEMRCFITGTDTGVGKTFVSSMLVRGLRARGLDAVGMKPLCCGERDDALVLHAANAEAIPLNDVNPFWLRTPAAPYTASLIENRPIDLDLIRATCARVAAGHESIVVEGIGGWRVPITRDYDMSDFAAALELPVIIVVANRLGALNHTLLTYESIAARKLPCAGLIVNHVASANDDVAAITNLGVLEDLFQIPVLYEIAHGQRELVL